jgi:hypothetical protein
MLYNLLRTKPSVDHLGRIAGDDRIPGTILGDYAPCRNNGPAANPQRREKDGSMPNPSIIFDAYLVFVAMTR